MCVVSFVGDQFGQRWEPWTPYIPPYNSPPPQQDSAGSTLKPFSFTKTGPSQKDFDELKREVELLKELLKGAKEYDERNNEPDCEIEAKMQFLKEVAKLVGIDLDEILKKPDGGTKA